MARTINGYPEGLYRVTAPAWCRHKDIFVIYTIGVLVTGIAAAKVTGRAQCSNCGADTGVLTQDEKGKVSVPVAADAARWLAHNELMRLERVAILQEIPAP